MPDLICSYPDEKEIPVGWHEEFYAAVDGMDAAVMAAWLTADTTVRFGNQELIRGRDAVMVSLSDFWGQLVEMKHEFVNVVESGQLTFVESVVTYMRLDGRRIKLPSATAILRDGQLVAAQRIYADMQPLFAS
jgi:SnoaL-like domain